MVLPLYLAMTAAEIQVKNRLPRRCAYMACHFSPCTLGLINIPQELPAHSVLILNDRLNCDGHSPQLVSEQLREAVSRLDCESLLLDFQRPPAPEVVAMVNTIAESFPCPVAVSEGFAADLDCPVFLSPGPLHLPLEEYIAPWKGREIWLEAALSQEEVTVTKNGAAFTHIFPPAQLSGRFYDETLRCHYIISAEADRIRFTLFDTPQSLEKKLILAAKLGVTRAVGLWQELRTFQTGK